MTKDPAVRLRPARAEDAEVVAEIWHRGWADGHLGHVPDELVAARTRESFDRRAPERVGDTTVAVVAGEIAGFVMVLDDQVEQVFVAAAHRGSGVATAVLAEAERLIRSNGYERAWLAVVPGNTRARRFYARQGWADEGLFDHLATGTKPGRPIPVPCRRYVKPLTS